MADIYRKSSLEKLSSPEQLDKMIKITSPSVWISFIGIIIVIVAVIIWAIFGKLPENLQISGIYTNSNTTIGIFSNSSGMVTNLDVEVGSYIENGDIIGKIQDPTKDANLKTLKEEFENVSNITLTSINDISTSNTSSLLEIKSKFSSLDNSYVSALKQLEVCKNSYNEQEKNVDELKKNMEIAEKNYISSLDNDNSIISYDYQKANNDYSMALSKYESCLSVVKQYESLSEQELYTCYDKYQKAIDDLNEATLNYNDVFSIYIDLEEKYKNSLKEQNENSVTQTKYSNEYSIASSYYNNAYATLLSLKSQLDNLQINVDIEKRNLDNSTIMLENQFNSTKEAILNDLQSQIDQLEDTQKYMDINSNCTGTVVGIYAQVGQSVSQGTKILKVKQDNQVDEENFILCYVPLADAKKIDVGMKVTATPSTVDEQEYGHMIGEVVSVGEYCADTQEMVSKLGDEALVNSFQSNGPVIEVIVALDIDETTMSGYAWSNKKGNNVTLTENTFISLKIITDEKAPITKLIPSIKKILKGETNSNSKTQQQN